MRLKNLPISIRLGSLSTACFILQKSAKVSASKIQIDDEIRIDIGRIEVMDWGQVTIDEFCLDLLESIQLLRRAYLAAANVKTENVTLRGIVDDASAIFCRQVAEESKMHQLLQRIGRRRRSAGRANMILANNQKMKNGGTLNIADFFDIIESASR